MRDCVVKSDRRKRRSRWALSTALSLIIGAIAPNAALAADDVQSLVEDYNRIGLTVLQKRAAEPRNYVFSPYATGMLLNFAYRLSGHDQLPPLDNIFPNKTLLTVDAANGKLRDLMHETRSVAAMILLDTRTSAFSEASCLAAMRKFYDFGGRVSTDTQPVSPKLLTVPDELAAIVRFEALWKRPFDENLAGELEFERSDGRVRKIRIMHGYDWLAYKNAAFTAIQLSYEEEQFAFVAIMPSAGHTMEQAADSLADLGIPALQEELHSSQPAGRQLSMPKFWLQEISSVSNDLVLLGAPRTPLIFADCFPMQKGKPKEYDINQEISFNISPLGSGLPGKVLRLITVLSASSFLVTITSVAPSYSWSLKRSHI